MKRTQPSPQSQDLTFSANSRMRDGEPPAHRQCSWASQPRGEISKNLTVQQPLIVIIDDSPTVRAIVKTCLQRAAFRVREFNDGVEAFRWLGSPEGEVPSLVFLDIGLPHMDGYEVLRLLRAKPKYRQTVTIMLSCRDGVIDRLKGRLAGASAYVTKPFRTEDLLAITRAALARSDSLSPSSLEQRSSATGSHAL